MLLQFTVEILVVRNYTLAVLFITPLALVIASGGRHLADGGSLLGARAVDTIIGCIVALVIFRLAALRTRDPQLPQALARTLDAAADVSAYRPRHQPGAAGPAGVAGRGHRLAPGLRYANNGTATQHREAEHAWPAVVAAQRLAYQVLAACWDIEHIAVAQAAEARVREPYGGTGSDQDLAHQLRALAIAAGTGTAPAPAGPAPAFVAAELAMLRLTYGASDANQSPRIQPRPAFRRALSAARLRAEPLAPSARREER
jgi:uncharacterized membrane protein YccC